MFFSILCNGIQEATTSRVNSSINYRLWVILTRHCRLISRKKWTLVGDGDNGGGDHACVGQAVYTAKSHLNVAVNPKTAQKSKVLIIKKKTEGRDFSTNQTCCYILHPLPFDYTLNKTNCYHDTHNFQSCWENLKPTSYKEFVSMCVLKVTGYFKARFLLLFYHKIDLRF